MLHKEEIVMVVRCYKNAIASLLLAFMLWGMTAGVADADFYFRGYTYNETNVALNNTNVSIEIYSMGGQTGLTLVGTNYTSSNATGYFNLSINGSFDNQSYMYKPVLKHFLNNATTGTLDWIGQALPQLPYRDVSTLTISSPMNFYMRKGGTINFNATNSTGGTGANQNFTYMIKDTRLGYPIAENFNVEQGNVTVHVPMERNYSIMIFPNRSLPIYYNLNNLTEYVATNYTVNITFDTGIAFRWVSGNATYHGGANFENLNVIAYLMEPGDMLAKKHPLPENMSAWQQGGGWPNTFNATTGFFNFTLPGSAQGSGVNLMLFATAKNGSEYYGAFRNITLNYSPSGVPNFNFTLVQLLGNEGNITLDSSTGGRTNVTTKLLQFQLKNGTDNTNITQKFAHVEIEVNYSTACTNCSSFKWMVGVDPADNGSFSIPALNANIRKINVFMQDSAPLKISKTAAQLANPPVLINLTQFKPGDPDAPDAGFSDVFMQMSKSTAACDVPYPPAGCSLTPDPATAEGNMSIGDFNPFKIVMGGGKISLRISKPSQRITVHYKNVDMLASGPPDASFDESANSSQSGSTIEEAWKFGSKGPEIYDEVIIGVPLTTTSISGVRIGKLYDENWNAIWDLSAGNTSADIPSDYSAFPSEWFSSTGRTCTTDASSNCYINTTDGILWLRIPHFSGVGPTVLRTTGGGGGGSSGSSTGGGGVVSSESYANIAKAERYDKSLIANTPVTYTFKAPEHGIFEIAVTGKENENDIAIRVEALKGLSKSVSAPPDGVVYKHLNIIAGTAKIKEAVIKFKIENSWLADNNLGGSEVKLMRWDGSKWNGLETAEKNKDGTFTFYEAKTTGFSSFAITGVKAAAPTAAPTEAAVTATPAEAPTTAPTPVPPKKGMPGFEAIAAIIVITLLAASLVNDRKRR